MYTENYNGSNAVRTKHLPKPFGCGGHSGKKGLRMRRRWILHALCAFLLSVLPVMPALADIMVSTSVSGDGTNQIVTFTAAPGTETDAETAAAFQEVLDEHFKQSDAFRTLARVLGRGGERTIYEQGFLCSTDRFLSMLLIWNGQQPGGGRGSKPLSLCADPVTGNQIQLFDLFVNADTARARLEELIERDILGSISDYLEFAELLPMPDNCFYIDADGLTIYYDDLHYRTFAGDCGAVHFAWYEIADLIDPNGPAGQMTASRADADALRQAVQAGSFGDVFPVRLGDKLGDVLGTYPKLSDPDYTRNSKLYLFEAARLRGFAVEIPKYALTETDETPVSAIRSSRIDFYGLKTGWTGREEITELLGSPESVLMYDEQTGEDMMLSSGESLFYTIGGNVLEVHLDAESLLSTLILRSEMPE